MPIPPGTLFGALEVIERTARNGSGPYKTARLYRLRCRRCGRNDLEMTSIQLRGRGGRKGCPACLGSAGASTAEYHRVRRARVLAAFMAGESLREIAGREGVTLERVRQWVAKGVTNAELPGLVRLVPDEALRAAVLALPAQTVRRVLYAALGAAGADHTPPLATAKREDR